MINSTITKGQVLLVSKVFAEVNREEAVKNGGLNMFCRRGIGQNTNG